MELTMKTGDILNTVTRTLPGWHVYNDHQFGRITACDPQAGYEIAVNLPYRGVIHIVRTRYELEHELVEDATVLNTSDMGEEQTLDELARLLAAPMPRTDRLIRLKERFGKTAEWCRNALGDEQEEHTGLPVAVLNTQLYAKPEDDIEDGQYVSLFQLYIDGFELSRTGRK